MTNPINILFNNKCMINSVLAYTLVMFTMNTKQHYFKPLMARAPNLLP